MKINLRRVTTGAVLIAAASAFLFCTGFTKASDHGNHENGYLKSATYYSDDWVINFWNSESSHMDEELKQIREDGFNSIILVVPWREFQPSMAPEHYNDYAWEKFDRVMKAAKAQDLKVMLRVGYTWDYYSSENVLARYEKLLYDSETKKAWLHYAKRLYEKASAMTISAAVLLPGKISGILRKMAVPFMEAGSQDGKWQHSAAIPSM